MKDTPSFYSIIPAAVRYDSDLSALAKLLYSEITCLSTSQGACFAKNQYFSKLYEISEREVIRILNQLQDRGYISIDRSARPRQITLTTVFGRVTKMSPQYDKNVTPLNNINNNIYINNNNNSAEQDVQTPKILFEFPQKNGTGFSVTDELLTYYTDMYPNLDVMAELKKMYDWLISNPSRRKNNVRRYISNWLMRSSQNTPQQQQPSYVYDSNPDADYEKRKADIENGYY